MGVNGIEKLEERLAADPASKVFVPLAEEYRKAGHLDRALAVLRSGLSRNPGYGSARVALARVHLQRGELVEARELLTQLVAEAPDNLLALRLLEETGPPASAEPEPAATPQPAPGRDVPSAAAPEPERDSPQRGVAAAPETPTATTLPPAPTVVEAAPSPESGATPKPAPEATPTWATQRLSRDAVLAQLASASGYDALSDHKPVAPPGAAPLPTAPPANDDWRHGFEAMSEGEREQPLTDPLPRLGEMGTDPIAVAAPELPAPEPPAPAPLEPEPPEPEVVVSEWAAPEPVAPDPVVPEPALEVLPPAAESIPEFEPLASLRPQPEPEEDVTEAVEPPRVAEPPAPAVVRTLTLARLYRRQGHFDRAARVYRDLLDLDPTNTEASRELGELCGEGLADITDDDVVPREEAPATALPRAHAESLAAVRQRKIEYLRSWLDQMRSEG